MRFLSSGKALREAAALCEPLSGGRHNAPVAKLLLAEASGDTLRVSGTNHDTWVSARCGCAAERSGTALLPPKFLASLPDGEVVVEAPEGDAGRVTASSGGRQLWTTKVDCAPGDFPRGPVLDARNQISGWACGAKALRSVWGRVLPAMCSDVYRGSIWGALAQQEGAEDAVRWTATDGHRIFSVALPAAEGCLLAQDEVAPRSVVEQVRRLLKLGGDVRFGVHRVEKKATVDDQRQKIVASNDWWRVEVGVATVVGKSLGLLYPDWRRVVPTADQVVTRVEGAAAPLLGAIWRLRKAGEKSVRLVMCSEDEMVVEGCSGELSERVPCAVSPPRDGRVGFNLGYLEDHVEACPGARLEFGDEFQPVASWIGEDVFVTMPERV